MQPGNTSGILSGLALGIVEVGGNSDHRLSNFFAKKAFGVFFQLHQNKGGELLGIVATAIEHDPVIAAHVTLDRGHGLPGIHCHLPPGTVTDKPVTVFCKCYDGRGCTSTLRIGNDYGFAAFHNGNTAVGSSQIYTYYFAHSVNLSIKAYLSVQEKTDIPYSVFYCNGYEKKSYRAILSFF